MTHLEEKCFRFLEEKEQKLLSRRDIDHKIQDLIETLNYMKQTWTTGSCQGHWDSKRNEYFPAQSPYLKGVTRTEDLLNLADCATQAKFYMSVATPNPAKQWSIGHEAEQLCRNGRLPKDTLEWWIEPKKLEGAQKDQEKFRTFHKCLLEKQIL